MRRFRRNRRELDLALYAKGSRWLPGREPCSTGRALAPILRSQSILQHHSGTLGRRTFARRHRQSAASDRHQERTPTPLASTVMKLAWRAFVFSLANAGVAENGYVQLWRSVVVIGGRS